MAALYAVDSHNHSQQIQAWFQREGELLVDTISAPLSEALLTNDLPQIESIATQFRQTNPNVVRIEIYRAKTGRIYPVHEVSMAEGKKNLQIFTAPISVSSASRSKIWSLGDVKLWLNREGVTKEMETAGRRVLAVLWTVFLVLLGGLYFFANRMISQPIVNLSRQFKNWSSSGAPEKLQYVGADEIGDLYRAFNELVINLNRVTVSRNYFQKMLDTMSDLVMVVEPEKREFTYVNSAALSAMGYSRSELMGSNVSEVLRAKDLEVMLSSERKALKDGEILLKTGRVLPVIFSTARLPDGMLLVAKDMSQIEDLQAQVIHAEKLASLGTLAAGIGHEINNPLAILKGSVELLRKRVRRNNLEPSVEKAFDTQLRAIGRIARIVGSLRKMAAGPGQEESQSLNLGLTCREVLNLFEGIDRSTGIEFSWSDKTKETVVESDESAIHQILTNLVTNARDAVSHKKENGRVAVTLDRDETHARVVVSDNGQGIEADKLRKIFDSFYTTKGLGHGTGLGLSISLQLARKLGGDIQVESTPGKGSVFTLYLPLAGVDAKTPVAS